MRIILTFAVFIQLITLAYSQGKQDSTLYKFQGPWFGNNDAAFTGYLTNNMYLKGTDFRNDIRGDIRFIFLLSSGGNISEFKFIDSTSSEKLNGDVRKAIEGSSNKWVTARLNDKNISIFIMGYVKLFATGTDDHKRYSVIARYDFLRDALLFNNYYNAGADLAGEKKFVEAIPFFDQVINFSANDIDAYYNRGVCYHKTGRQEKACQDWNAVKALGKTDCDQLILKYCNMQILK